MSQSEIKTFDDRAMPWLEQYLDVSPKELPEIQDENLGDFLRDIVSRYKDLPMFTNYKTTLTYQEIFERATALAAYLQNELGYQKGDRLAIMMPNLLQYPIALYACYLSGIIAVNVNPLYTAGEVQHQLYDAGVRGIVIAENFAHTLAKVREELPELKEVIITRFGDEHGFLMGALVNSVVRYIYKLVPPYHINNTLNYKEIIPLGRKLELQPVKVEGDDVAMLQYTGGTTGIPKGAMLTHRNLLVNITQVKFWVSSAIDELSLKCITPLPMYHIFCCTCNALCVPDMGMHSILVTNPRHMKSFIAILKRHSFSVIVGVNTLFKGLLNQPDFAKLDFSNIRFIISGGMPLEKTVAEKWKSVTGNAMVEGYGLTECSPIVCANLIENEGFTNGIGYPLPGTLISLRDDNGNHVVEGEAGELWVKGEQVMKGYWNKPEDAAQVITPDGWMKTGDVATMSKTGFVKIVDRKKDMILVSGFNVYPNEVEAVLAQHSAVLECAVIGVKDGSSGEIVKAFIVVKPDHNVTQDELRQFTRKKLTNYKRPKQYEFMDELPKSNVGKILRRELVAREQEKLNT